jgi:hypothetical protein
MIGRRFKLPDRAVLDLQTSSMCVAVSAPWQAQYTSSGGHNNGSRPRALFRGVQ